MKTLLGVLLWRPSYKTILNQLVKVNPGLKADLVLTNDTGKELDIGESLTNAWDHITVLNDPSDIFAHISMTVNTRKLKNLHFKKVALWQNTLLLYALQKGYDNLLIWEDDQIFYVNVDDQEERKTPAIFEQTHAFFSPQINTLNTNRNIDVCVSKRQGYLHRVPPFIINHIPETVLNVLEKSLCLCNEIVFSGLLTKPAGGFIPFNEPSPYGGVEYFGNQPFIYAGSLAINLHSTFPCFYDVPDLPGQNFSRGNDTFFSLGYNGGMVAQEVESTYFHDPYMVSTLSENPNDCFSKPIDCGSVDNFLTLIKGWFSYSCLLLRLSFPYNWTSRIKEIDSLLKGLPGEFASIYNVFNQYAQRVPQDYISYTTTLDTWRMICEDLRQQAYRPSCRTWMSPTETNISMNRRDMC
jgi:hypothetical protein